MADVNEKKIAGENEEETEEMLVLTLTDEETGEEKDYVVMAEADLDEQHYYCVVSYDAYQNEKEDEEGCGLLRVVGEEDDIVLETIDDDEEYEKVSDFFDDLLFSEEDYDN